MLPATLGSLFQEWDRGGVRWVLLRQISEIASRDSGDIDLLVHPDDLPSIWPSLEALEFAPLPYRGPGFHWLCYEQETDRWLWLHIVLDLSFGPYSLLKSRAESECLARRQRDGAIYRLASNDEFWVLLLHCLFDKHVFLPRHRQRLVELFRAASDEGPFAVIVAEAGANGWTPRRILNCIRLEKWSELEQLGPILAKAWMHRDRIGRTQIFEHQVRHHARKLWSFYRARGVSVAVLGPDGAGKSTLIADMERSFVFPVRSVYMGLTGGLLPYANRLRFPLFVIPARLFIFWARYLKAQYHRKRGRLVLFDRYIYDSEVPTPYGLNRLQQVYRWIDGHAIPGPDLSLLLDAPGEVMYQRKGEYSPEMLEDWRRHFLRLAQSVKRVEVVNTALTKNGAKVSATGLIWREYLKRWTRTPLKH